MFQMVTKRLLLHFIQSSAHGSHLGQDVYAVALFLDHTRYTAHLPFNAAEAGELRLSELFVHSKYHTPVRYTQQDIKQMLFAGTRTQQARGHRRRRTLRRINRGDGNGGDPVRSPSSCPSYRQLGTRLAFNRVSLKGVLQVSPRRHMRRLQHVPYGQKTSPTDAPSRRLTMIAAQEPAQSLAQRTAPSRRTGSPLTGTPP